MSVIVRDTGFAPEDFTGSFVPLEALAEGDRAVDVGPADGLEALEGRLGSLEAIRIAFQSFSDGRGFTLARDLRARGFAGRLRAQGHVIADQYAMARRCGFDEVEISEELAARQPQDQWQFRADWRDHDYQARLRG
ncbi:DUF934 domain-containing protein [Pseudoroseicyclus aestuarii]|uniref:Uncharacterized protein DUF934 n=1 Tax=Pseudoroseicyclus aestuarii TaxID=1795041 RepID=A0A318TBZ5_9RHOB|nr:DUF934 domain-containing protein [Pseudoroseicyclus aestuarii]PYE85858.1 uncharacterized protein DUF934 [Pseudoroseicyclus aestuarii]